MPRPTQVNRHNVVTRGDVRRNRLENEEKPQNGDCGREKGGNREYEGRENTYIFFAKQLFLCASQGILQYVLFGLNLIHLSQLAHKTLHPISVHPSPSHLTGTYL